MGGVHSSQGHYNVFCGNGSQKGVHERKTSSDHGCVVNGSDHKCYDSQERFRKKHDNRIKYTDVLFIIQRTPYYNTHSWDGTY